MQPPLPSDTIPDGHKQPDTHPVVIWRKDKDAQSGDEHVRTSSSVLWRATAK